MSSLIVCHACDLVHRREALLARARVRCVRCRAELYRTSAAGIDTALALASTALVLFALSNAFPLVALQLGGTTRNATLLGAAAGIYHQGFTSIAALVLITTFIVPLIQISTFLFVLIPLRSGHRAPAHNELFRWLVRLRPWALPEVFLLGALVALVKLSALAQVVPGIALFCYGLMMLTLSALTSVTPTEQFWQWVARSEA